MPGVAVFEVSDANQAKKLLEYSLGYNGPMYIRSTVEPTEDIYPECIEVVSGGSKVVRDGNDGAFLCSGVIVQYAIEASDQIAEECGKRIRVVDMYSLKPIDRYAIIDAAITGIAVIAQDHNVYGGLGSLAGVVIAEEGISTKMRILGIPDRYVAMAHAPYLYKKFGLDADGLKETMLEMLKRK